MGEYIWAVSGSTFLRWYFGAAVGVVIAVWVIRRILTRGDTRGGWHPGAEELAYFSGGPGQAILAALAGLRASNAITTYSGGRLAVVGHPPPAPSALSWAVYQAAQRGHNGRRLADDPGVRPALTAIHRLVHQGWLLASSRRSLIRMAWLLILGVVAVGMVRGFDTQVNDNPNDNIMYTAFGLFLVGLPLLTVPTRSRAAQRQLKRVWRANFHLHPVSRPSLATYGAPGAALAVGLFGAAALWAMDPVFAAELHVTRSGAGGGDSGGGGGCGGGCGGGD
jgi:uncharacterized protein (TIGR04222 family)